MIKPILEGVRNIDKQTAPERLESVDQHYQNLRIEMAALFTTLGIAC